MPIDPLPIIRAYPDHLRERIRRLNRLPVQEERGFVLYWMHHAVRGHENPALDAAIFAANLLRKPVLVYQGLGGRHPYNSDRHYTFIMEGCREVQRELTYRNISYCFHLDRDPATPTPLMKIAAQSALTLTEDFPAPPINAWAERAAATLPTAFWAVDTACIMPMQLLKTSYTRAFLFRKHTWAEFEARIARRYEEQETAIDRHHSVLDAECLDLQSAELAELCGRCRIDHTIAPVPHTQGGSTAGYARWEQFKRHGLPDYADTRNDAAIAFPKGVSRMSAYLHHGHVSPFRIAREAAQFGGDGAEKFLDEMLIWRELAHNFCFHHSHPHTLASLPSWALRTLEDHRHDSRRPVYTREQLLRGTTGDPLWDAAQQSLMIHGELHNNLRMTWGKALLQWTPSPEAALQTMIELNHRFALDGSDPNSYGGILWCLGLFDRPFQPEKPIIGTLRPRSTRSHAARLDLETYQWRVSKPAASVSLRVAVVGAGMSGLVAGRTIADHGHAVQVFEKEHVAGGRMSTRWMDEYAFDHGAQYFTVRDERFERWVDSWVESGIVKRWEGRIRVLHNGDIRPENREQIRYVGVPGMNSVARHLSDSLSVRWGTCVRRIRKEGRDIVLFDEKGAQLGGYDALIVSTPPEQGVQLLSGATALVGQVASVRMDPCWSVMLAFRDPLDLDADGLFIHGSALVWAGRNSSKPGRGTADTWVLHAGSEWSAANLDLDPDEVAGQLTKTFFDAAVSPTVEPLLVSAHCWRHARTANPLEEECLWDSEEKIGVCGDWCCRSRIEGAFLSGAALAGRILGAAGTWQESSRKGASFC